MTTGPLPTTSPTTEPITLNPEMATHQPIPVELTAYAFIHSDHWLLWWMPLSGRYNGIFVFLNMLPAHFSRQHVSQRVSPMRTS